MLLTVVVLVAVAEPVNWPASAGAAPLLRPAPVQEDMTRRWLAERRRLRIRFGVSAGVLGVSAAGLALSVGLPRGDGEQVDWVPIGAIVCGIAAAASLIPTIVYAVRLTAHNERRPAAARVRLDQGLGIRF
jgi:hypothetical protein